ncbi:universal stress protein [Streptomyces sp. NPDC088196]|uniref:universal stress protein n=1 Tax=Streptomyces sp. NPDC088196 TaxID=3154868 RepID=UPI00344F1EB7
MGSPVAVLESGSREASLVVVGSRPPGRSGSLRAGSVAGQLAAHGRSPVLVVRGGPDPTGAVVPAGGHTQEARAAVEFAYAEASARGANLVVLDRTPAWNSRSQNGFADTLSVLSEKYPDVTVHRARVRGGLCRALVESSTRAQLVVVGSRNRDRLAGALPGAVSRAALHHADCPVAVIRSVSRAYGSGSTCAEARRLTGPSSCCRTGRSGRAVVAECEECLPEFTPMTQTCGQAMRRRLPCPSSGVSGQ